MTVAAVTRFLLRFSERQFVLNENVYHPGQRLFPRVHIRWSLDYLGEVRRLEISPGEVFFFSLTRVVPYPTTPGVWSPITDAGVNAYMNDPEFNSGEITHASEELTIALNPDQANAGNVIENEQSNSTSEFGA